PSPTSTRCASRSSGIRCGRAAASARTPARGCAAWGSSRDRAALLDCRVRGLPEAVLAMSARRDRVWEVFARQAYEEPLHHVGAVTEEDEDLALVSARAIYDEQ